MSASKTKDKKTRTLRLHLALRFVWQSTRGWTLVNLVLVILQGPLPLISLYLMKLMVDKITAGLEAADPTTAFQDVMPVVLLIGITGLFTTLIGLVAGLANQAQALVVGDYMQNIVHAKSVEVDLAYYENPQYYDTLRRAQREAASRPLTILRNLTQLGQNSLSLLAIVGLLLSFHWAVAFILVIAVIPGFLVRLKFSGKLYHWQRKRTSVDRMTMYFDFMLTGGQHAKEIRLFELGPLFMERFGKLRKQLRHERLRLAVLQALFGLAAQLATTLAIYGSYAFIAYNTLQGSLGLGDLVMYYQAFQRGRGFLQQILSSFASLYEDNLFLINLYEFLDLKPDIIAPPNPKPMPRPMQKGIMFEHVAFQYPQGSHQVLKDINLSIRPGEKIALVGENGSGKTTLIKLLCRLYDPTEGIITVDGVDLREFDPAAFRREIGVILQDYAHYNLTAQENVWFGNVQSSSVQEHIVAVAQYSGADTVIEKLPKKYDTILGKMFQDGEELSIGEWQKVALARAFLRGAQLIVLDEPTSAMDARSEYEVFKKLRVLTENRATVTISHRFSTVRMADTIYVLDDGQVLESGSHEELMRYDGKYAFLFETQAQHYQ